MSNFSYYTPTPSISAKIPISRSATSRAGMQKGSDSFRGQARAAAACSTSQSLNAANVALSSLAASSPTRISPSSIRASTCAKREGVDFILAVGGGSVIDSAKAIGSVRAWTATSGISTITSARPKAVCPSAWKLTIAASGSEMSDSSVITKEGGAASSAAITTISAARSSPS